MHDIVKTLQDGPESVEILWSEGPWLGDELEKAWENYYGILNSKAREIIRTLTVSKTLALSGIILNFFHSSITRSPEWALSSLPTAISYTPTARLYLFKKITGLFSGLVIWKDTNQAVPPQRGTALLGPCQDNEQWFSTLD